jgi:ATP-dependent Lon protease
MFFREQKTGESGSLRLPMMPLREVVVFPQAPISLIVGREKSVAAVVAANENGGLLFLVTQRRSDQLDPGTEDMFQFGVVAKIEQTLHLPDGNMKILVEGRRRARLVSFVDCPTYFKVEVEEYAPREASVEIQALVRTVKTTFERYVKLNRSVPPEMLLTVNALEDPDRLADSLIAVLQFKLPERQELLEEVDVEQRLERVYKALLTEIEFLQVEKKLKHRVKRERESNQREYWLNEQMKAIQKELGDKDVGGELQELVQAIKNKALPERVRARAEKELGKLAQMNPMSAEATVVRNYLDTLIELPWLERTEERPNLKTAAEILNADHYGLRTVKERILEYLAVETLVERVRGPILCLVGPPGVGKTSLAQSIARATGRPFVKMSLGGVRDEAEIRGHRRTYIGAMPGKLMQAMKRAKTTDPVILLDEIDKMNSDFRGDPASALLEVLDPEQNNVFNDHYLDLDYDLSKVMFVCTANSLRGIPIPLQDRLEIIELSGYTEQEKVAIGRKYLIPKQQSLHGLSGTQVSLSNTSLLEIVRRYTMESGVRELDRQIARVHRKVARRIVHYGQDASFHIGKKNLVKVLGQPKYEYGVREKEDQVGLVKGLAVAPWGGTLKNIEVAAIPGKGTLILTGKLGDVLKESANAGFTYIRSRAAALGLDEDFHETHDFHIHYPGSVTGIDGPSAGISMAVALVSALTSIPARSDTALTGEITLRGRVLPVGGIKEKILAAHRGGITRVVIPEKNRKDLDDLPSYVTDSMEILFVSHMDRVLKETLSTAELGKLFKIVPAETDYPVTPTSSASSPE